MRNLATVALLLVLLAGDARARGVRGWTYAQLADAADLIVIITPTATRVRPEKAPLPEMTHVVAQRVETEFKVLVILKGTPADPKQIALHHYVDTRTGPIGNGPSLVRFEPKDKHQYLAFLKKGADGQYTAATGQTDPNRSFEKLQQKVP